MTDQGTNTEATTSAVAEVAPSDVSNTSAEQEAVGGEGLEQVDVSQSDDVEDALLSQLVEDPEEGSMVEQPVEEAVEASQEQSEASFDPEKEYVFKDKDGNEHRVKGSDVIWLTSQYHRARQEMHDQMKAYQALEERFEVDKAGLAKDILSRADITEQLVAAKELLEAAGLTDLSSAIEQRMAQYGLEYNPLQPQVELLRRQQEALAQQQQQAQAVQTLSNEFSSLETKLGRKLSNEELQAVDSVYGQYLAAAKVNPQTPRPTLEEAYRLAVQAIDFNKKRQEVQKPPTQIERTRGSAPTADVSEDQLYDMLLKSA